MQISVVGNKIYKVSDNYIFLINIGYINKKKTPIYNDTNHIFILSRVENLIRKQNSNFFDRLTKMRKKFRKEDSIFKYYSEYIITEKETQFKKNNDCLLFAEKTSINDFSYDGKSSIFKVLNDKSSRRFGVSDKQNITITKYAKQTTKKENPFLNILINPEINDAYAIVPDNIYRSEGMCPYHVATVIFKDGNTNITIEADAGKKMSTPVFDMYSTTQQNMTFYAIHFKTYMQTYRDKSDKLKISLPTMLYLKKDFNNKKTKKHSVKKSVKSSKSYNTRKRK